MFKLIHTYKSMYFLLYRKTGKSPDVSDDYDEIDM